MRMKELLDLTHTIAKEYLLKVTYPWEIIPEIKDIVLRLIPTLDKDEYLCYGQDIFVHKSAKVAPTALLCSPCIIGPNSEIRHCAYIRGSVIIGQDCVIGNSCEIKNSILFDHVEVPHFNYVGDSILGYHSHMGAGAIASNIKADRSEVIVKDKEENIPTNLIKFGTILGDYVEIGCNSVLNPGTIVGRNTTIYPLSNVRGVIDSNCIYKSKDYIVSKK